MSIRRSVTSRGPIFRLCAVAAAVSAAMQPATAQETEEILVTGSRVSQSGFDSPQPLTSINSEQIENLGIVNVGDVIRTMPQNTPFFAETNVGFGNFNVGAQLANLRGLNPFFGTRTLTLVDTKRVVGTTEGGAVDITLIPSMLVERTEVVTGGASAAYGSDAIAGVVNVILDKNLEGFKAQADYGQTGEGDGDDTHASFAFGTAFADEGRGHVLFGAEYQKQDLIGPCARNRDWCRDAWFVGTNGAFATGNGFPNFVVTPGGEFPTSDTGQLTSGGVTRQFSADGSTLLPYNAGQFPGVFARLGGDGTISAYDLSSIRPEIERYSLMGRASYEISDRLNIFAEVAYAQSDAENRPANGALGPFGAGVAVAGDNAFLTPAARAIAPTGGTFTRIFLPGVISAFNTTENETQRLVAGVDGSFGEKWNWDAYYQYGTNENHQRLYNNLVNTAPFTFLAFAIDSVRSNPADPTSPIVCRATLPGATFRPQAAGCVPLNIFGNGNATQAGLEYAFRTLKEDSDYEQNVVGVNFRSTIAEGWAGPIGFATGLEWRNDDSDTTHDVPNQPWYPGYFLSYGLDRGGEIDVLEAYGEVDVPMAEKLQTNFAMRRTQNEAKSTTGSAPVLTNEFNSWKASAIYDPLEFLRFRTTLSRDVRAAGFRELFLPRVDTQAVPGGFPNAITNPWTGAPDAFLSITGGNPNLEPETADTKTFGVVLSFDRVRFSADWFEIEIADAITPGGAGGAQAQALAQACFLSGGTAALCSRVPGFGPGGDITAVDARSINIGKFTTHGIDYEASYDLPLDTGGNINLRFIASYLNDLTVDPGLGAPPVDYRDQTGPVASFGGFNTSPEWQARAWVTYVKDRFTSTFETRYIGSGKLNATWTESAPGAASNRTALTVTDNSVDDAYYLAWSGSWNFRQTDDDNGMELFWVVNNLLDKDPAIAPGGNSYPTNPVFFDTLGRRFRVGVRFAF
jgi:iron complex outermembrane recepter protein